MHPSRTVRIVGGVAHLLTHPSDLSAILSDRRQKGSPVERRLPWMTWGAIRMLREKVGNGSRVFEWGGGGSTLFFLDLGAEVHTVESHPGWCDTLRNEVVDPSLAGRWTLHEVPTEPDASAYINSIHTAGGDGWDVIVVDGISDTRMDCLREATKCLKPGGVIILDDSWRPEYGVSDEIMQGYTRVKHPGPIPNRPRMSRTDHFVKN